MNPLAILSAIAAVAFFPGAAYAGAVALAVTAAARMPPGLGAAQLDELVAAVGVTAACGMLALPGSPLFGLPAGVSLLVLITALAAGVAWATSESWPWQRAVAAVAVLAPLFGLAAAAGTLDLRTLAVAGGTVGAARPWAVAAVLVALPSVVRPFDPSTARAGRAALTAAVGLAGLSLLVFAPLAGLPAPLVALVCALAVVVYAGLIAGARQLLPHATPALSLLALVPAVISLVIALA